MSGEWNQFRLKATTYTLGLVCAFGLGACTSTPGPAPRAPFPRPAAAAAVNDDDVTGRCEVVVPGRDGPAPCDGLTLFLRDRRGGEERRAEVSGFDFRFRNLNRRSYVLSATSAGYDVETNVRDEVTPGQVLQLRVRATPHPGKK